MSSYERLESAGRFLGEKALKPTLEYLRLSYTENFNVNVFGKENIETLINNPHLLISNHIPISQADSGVRPDHLFIYKAVFENTNEKISIVGQIDYEKTSKLKLIENFRDNIYLPLKEGLHFGLGDDLIPVRNHPSKLNRLFLEKINETFDIKHRSVLIFPQGDGKIDFDPDMEFKSGVYHVFKHRQKKELISIPILPVYIHGCDSWIPRKNQSIEIIFGKPFNLPDNFDKAQVADIMKNKIWELKNN